MEGFLNDTDTIVDTIDIDSDVIDSTEELYSSEDYKKLLGLLPMLLVIVVVFLKISWSLYKSLSGQKTRNPQQRRVYVGSRSRPSLAPSEPTIYVSPSNLPPPPKYEAMAPPSYEEVVGIHYPNYQAQPITQPISAALAQSSGSQNVTYNEPATVTVTTEERRTSVARS